MAVIYSKGTGLPLVVIPGIQGRWEWMLPALRALERHCQTISYSLCGDFAAGWKRDRSHGFDNYLRQLDEVLDHAGLKRVALCGISYGGFIALRYAATRPERVSHLVLTSAPSPQWKPNQVQSRYISKPWISTPAFIATAPQRLWPEICAAYDSLSSRLAFCATHALRVITAPAIPSMMAARIVEQQSMDFTGDCAAINCRTLVVTGEPHLDAIVPVEATCEYLSLIPNAKYAVIERTGHLGLLTRADTFASVVSSFISDADNHRP